MANDWGEGVGLLQLIGDPFACRVERLGGPWAHDDGRGEVDLGGSVRRLRGALQGAFVAPVGEAIGVGPQSAFGIIVQQIGAE